MATKPNLKLLQCMCPVKPSSCAIHYKYWDEAFSTQLESTDKHLVEYDFQPTADGENAVLWRRVRKNAVNPQSQHVVWEGELMIVPIGRISVLVHQLIDLAMIR